MTDKTKLFLPAAFLIVLNSVQLKLGLYNISHLVKLPNEFSAITNRFAFAGDDINRSLAVVKHHQLICDEILVVVGYKLHLRSALGCHKDG